MTVVMTTELPLRRLRRGKVRDVYEVDDARLLLVATDRVSAFDVVMRDAVPWKGAVLTQLTAWWLRHLEGEVLHHMLTPDVGEIVEAVPSLAPHRDALGGRAMLCRRATVVPIECVVRGYITGSAWKEYSATGTLAGERLAPGLRESDRLDPPIFSPATKADEGHDENITVDRMRTVVGDQVADDLERLSRLIYERGRAVGLDRGIIIADTKFEFGHLGDGRLALIDEVLTPDSSRFWPADRYEPGRSQPSFDKQPLRDYLDSEKRAGRWDGERAPDALPDHVVQAMSERYLDAYQRITGQPLDLESIG